MKRGTFLSLALFVIFSNCIGCFSNSIGDACESAAQCPSGASCDITAPDGYCFIQDCDPNGCPVDSICVPFENDANYCLRYCESDSDCRTDYVCRDDNPEGLGYCYVAASTP